MPVEIEGPILVALFDAYSRFAVIDGLHLRWLLATPFTFAGRVLNFRRDPDGTFVLASSCYEIDWGDKKCLDVVGNIVADGVWGREIHFRGWCFHISTGTNLSFGARGCYANTGMYSPEEGAKRASLLVGQADRYFTQSAHVVNFAVYGTPYLEHDEDCSLYANPYFEIADDARRGYIILGNDSRHCGIVSPGGKEFIHLHPRKRMVTSTPLYRAAEIFPGGFVFRKYY